MSQELYDLTDEEFETAYFSIKTNKGPGYTTKLVLMS